MAHWIPTVVDKRRKQITFNAKCAGGADAVDRFLIQAWQKVLDELDARCSENAWDILVCQLTTQCGSATIFPARRNSGEQHEANFKVSLSVNPWAKAYEALPDGEEDEKKFNKAYDRLHKNQLRSLKKAIGDSRLKRRFVALKRRPSFAVFCVDEGDTPIRDRMEFLWGNRPPKRVFSTAKDLFEYVFHKAGEIPDPSMRIQNDKVIAVSWFGHDFTDRFVDLLDEVPNLPKLCSDLRSFVLTATRVSGTGIKRIKRMFPRAKFTVVSDQEFEDGIDPWIQ